ncbi:hypothetical protein FQN52_001939 [Onygenales sp. PD_12]|nr:hypothetical protein FQN52_001939 [Onygenales sp. PD_12]
MYAISFLLRFLRRLPRRVLLVIPYLPRLVPITLSCMLYGAYFCYCSVQAFVRWCFSKSWATIGFERVRDAESFEEWVDAARFLDQALGKNVWRDIPPSKYYDYHVIETRVRKIRRARLEGDFKTIGHMVRSGLVRNLVNITSPQLYNHAYSGTKVLIEDYISELGQTLDYVASAQMVDRDDREFDAQDRIQLFHDCRHAFGRTTLVLQGGAVFGTCHLGVIKALHLRGFLPRYITGTATGALIAALVGVTTDDELLPILNGETIDDAIFERAFKGDCKRGYSVLGFLARDNGYSWADTWIRRIEQYIRCHYFPDLRLLEEWVRTVVGDMTFEEAFAKTKRYISITIPSSGTGGIPNLLNYITAPNVLIWSAAAASNVSSATPQRIRLDCKDETGVIVPWPNEEGLMFRSWRQLGYNERECPLARLAELFNINHFIVSQARPYLVPIFRSQVNRPGKVPRFWHFPRCVHLSTLEIRHYFNQLDYLGFLPTPLRRLFIYEDLPGHHMVMLPEIGWWDMLKFLRTPATKESVQEWIFKGERGVWPAVCAVKVRCTVESALDRGHRVVKAPSKPVFEVGDE